MDETNLGHLRARTHNAHLKSSILFLGETCFQAICHKAHIMYFLPRRLVLTFWHGKNIVECVSPKEES